MILNISLHTKAYLTKSKGFEPILCCEDTVDTIYCLTYLNLKIGKHILSKAAVDKYSKKIG